MTYIITIHDIRTLRPEIVVGPGRDIPNKARTIEGAKRVMAKHLDGSLGRAPENMGRIVADGVDQWWYKGEQRTQSGQYIDRSIVLCEHRATVPTVAP